MQGTFPPEPLQTLPKSLRTLFVRFPSPLPHQPVVNGSLIQREEQNNEILPTVAKFATGETEKGFENKSPLPQSCWKPYYLHFTVWETKAERD